MREFNYVMTGYRDGRSLSCYLHDEGSLAAGIDGFTCGGYARVTYLWVSEKYRGRGLRGKLLAAADNEAGRRGFSTVMLDTHYFQAPEFYRRPGTARWVPPPRIRRQDYPDFLPEIDLTN